MKPLVLLLVVAVLPAAHGLWASLQSSTHAARSGRPLLNAAASKAALIRLCEDTPKNGVDASEERQSEIEAAIEALQPLCPPAPARRPLEGIYDLAYSSAKGGSNGKVGPFVGKVTQEFVDGLRFINAVTLGPAKISLYAEREVLDDERIRVTFKETGVSLFGKELVRKPRALGRIRLPLRPSLPHRARTALIWMHTPRRCVAPPCPLCTRLAQCPAPECGSNDSWTRSCA